MPQLTDLRSKALSKASVVKNGFLALKISRSMIQTPDEVHLKPSKRSATTHQGIHPILVPTSCRASVPAGKRKKIMVRTINAESRNRQVPHSTRTRLGGIHKDANQGCTHPEWRRRPEEINSLPR